MLTKVLNCACCHKCVAKCTCHHRCHACNIDVESKHRNRGYMLSAFIQYERAVEYIESLPVDAKFSITSVWKGIGRGLSEYNYTRHAIHDLYLHNLIVCVKKTTDNRCLSYQVKR